MRNLILTNFLCVLVAAWRRRYLIVVPILLMPIIGGAVGILTPKKYVTYTSVLIQEGAKQNPFLKDLTVETNLRERMAALQALLHSRHILGSVAKKMGMINDDMSGEDMAKKIAEFSSSLDATLVGDDLVKISYQSNDPSNMAEILGLVSVQFVERILAPQRSSIVKSENFLNTELTQRKIGLEKAETLLAEYKSKFASELPELHASNVIRLGRLHESLAERKTELEGARASRKDLQDRLFKTNPVIGKIEERIVEMMSELTILRSRYTDNHTKVIAALRKLKTLKDERATTLAVSNTFKDIDLERLWNMAANHTADIQNGQQPLLISQLEKLQESEGRVKNLEKQVDSLSSEINKLETKVTGFGVHEQRLAILARDADLNLIIYQDLAERHQMARVTGALGKAEEKERIKLIDPPFTPLGPINLSIWLFIILGAFGGGVLGISLAIIAELLDLTIRYRRQLETICCVPVITRIPKLTNKDLCPKDGGIPSKLNTVTTTMIPPEKTHG